MVSKLLPHEYEMMHERYDRLASGELRERLLSKTLPYPSVARQVLRERGEAEPVEKAE